jgi:structural maintenance of chromosome 4
MSQQFVSVIGPNGSGKSNLLESLLFIFGHRASRMRLKQLKELIHNSSGRRDLEKAQVSVTFKEIEEVGWIDQDGDKPPRVVETFTIARNIFSENSSSSYEISGVSKTRGDIVDLLKVKGMDMNNNRFLILQGEVEQISLMKPISGKREDPGLLEYLEDIIGSYKYVDQITELNDSLVDVRKVKETDMILLSDMGKELEGMADSKASAIAYFELEKKMMTLNHLRFYMELADIRETDSRLHQVIEKLQEDLDQDKRKMQETLEVYKNDFTIVRRLNDRKQQNKLENEQIDQQLTKAGDDDRGYQSRIKSLLTETHELEQQTKKLQADVEKAKTTKAEKQEQLPAKQEEAGLMKEKLAVYVKHENEIMARIEPMITKIKQQKEELGEKRAPLEREMKKLEDHKKTLIQQVDTLDKRDQHLATEIEKLEKDYGESHKTIKKEAEKKEQISIEYETSKQKIIALEAKSKTLQDETVNLNRQAEQISNTLEERRNKNASGVQKNQVLMYLMNNKEIQNRGGRIYGRIGDLGWIDQKYDIAISTISPKFNHILVDTMDTAKNCLELLKKDRIGMAKLLSLENIMGWKDKMREPFTAPPQSMRLFDLVKKKDEIAEVAFYYVLKDAICCQNLDIAQQVNNYNGRRHMVVTAEGYMVSPEGAMSGGGKPKTGSVLLTGSMSQQMNEEETPTEELMSMREKLQSAVRAAKDEQEYTQKNLYQLRNAMARVPSQIKSIEDIINQETRNLTNLQNKQEELQREKTDGRLEHARTECQVEIDKIHQNINKTMKELEKIKAKHEELDQQIEEFGGNELRDIKAQVTTYRATYETAQKIVLDLEAQIKQASKMIEQKQKESEDINLKITQNEDEKTNLLKLKDECEIIARELFEKKKNCMAIEAEISKEYTELQTKIQSIAKSIEDLKSSTKMKKEEQEKVTKQLAIIREENQRISEKLKQNKKAYLDFVASYNMIEEIKKIEKRANSQGLQGDSQVMRTATRTQMNIVFEQCTPDRDLTLEDIKQMNLKLDFVKSEILYNQQQRDLLNGDMEVIQTYKTKLSEYVNKETKYNDTCSREQLLRSDLNKLKESRRIEFMTGFSFISKKLKEVYQAITNGGDADLELIDSLDPFSEGVMFSVRPPHKSWKHMSKLSGGEKTLSSLSLIFALHYYKPTPIYFMDEIDAALDFRNVEIVGKFIKERTKNAQFIVISLRNHMFELANQLVGIYKVNDMTRTISLYPYQFMDQINEDMRREDEVRRTQSANRSQLSQARSQIFSKTSNAMTQDKQAGGPNASLRKSFAAAIMSRQSRQIDLPEDKPAN